METIEYSTTEIVPCYKDDHITGELSFYLSFISSLNLIMITGMIIT